MKIAIESTDVITTVNGQRVRLWTGLTEGGVRCQVFVGCLAVGADEDCSEFEREMRELPKPRELSMHDALLNVIDLRRVM